MPGSGSACFSCSPSPRRGTSSAALRAICRAARRAIRLRGLRLIVLARRLELLRALPGPPWMVPDPDLSESMKRMPLERRFAKCRGRRQAFLDLVRRLKTLYTLAGGRRYIPRRLKEAWA